MRTVKQPHGGAIKLMEKGDPGGPGRPPKLLSQIVGTLKAKGYERATANQVADAFETLLNLREDELRTMAKDKAAPYSVRIVASAMLDVKGWEVLQALLDRAHGKPKQGVEVKETKKTVIRHVWGS